MKKDLTLLILAAGMGSRFGGLKQIEPVGPNGEFIVDYSIYDAIEAGFTKVVFVIKEENYEIFKETVGKRIEGKVKVEYAFQKVSDIPEELKDVIPSDREKPLGTSHAVYAARNVINENFITINADDFYGRDAYMKAAEYLRNCDDDESALIVYNIGNTLTENGSVKRGVVFEENGELEYLKESSVIEENNMAKCSPLDGDETFEVSLDHPVSMNLFCLTKELLNYLEKEIVPYFKNCNDVNKDEFFLPVSVLNKALEDGKKVKIIKTDSKYYGMTYREDLEDLKNNIKKEIENGIYKEDLWK